MRAIQVLNGLTSIPLREDLRQQQQLDTQQDEMQQQHVHQEYQQHN